MQINSMWLGKFKINPAEALEPQFNVILGVGILATEIKRHGLTWRAVAAYNVGGGRVDTLRKTAEEYAIKVFRQFEKLEKGS
jgi:soluble lytic murein transglycosylase-like protein